MSLSRPKRLLGRWSCAAGLLALVAGAALPLAFAQPDNAQAPDVLDDAGALAGRDPTEGVYVRDSAVAVEKLAHAQRMERQQEWDNAASLYQEVLEKYPDRVVPSKVATDGRITQYTSVTNKVREQMSRWPQEGRAAYRARHDTAAQAMLDAARPDDVATLHRIISQYFISEPAKIAAQRLIDLYLERGEFLAAGGIADDLLRLYPPDDLATERPGVLYRSALAYQLGGSAAKANERLATLQRDFPQAVGTVRGKDVILSQSLSAELKANPNAQAVAASPDSWPVFHGDATRGRVSYARGKPGARLFGVDLAAPASDRISPQTRLQIEQQYLNEPASILGIMPVTDRGELFFQDGQQVYAVSLESGLPLPGWLQTNGAERDGRYVLPEAVGPARGAQNTLTVTEDAVFAVMGTTDRILATYVGNSIEPQLVCLDRRTGKELWKVAPSRLGEDAAEIRQLRMSGSPLVVGDSVLVIGRGTKQQQFDDCWVLCFDRANGSFRWSCYVASATNLAAMIGAGGLPATQLGDATSHLAYAEGRVYVLSNLGALAAIDAYSGTIVWLDIYPNDRQLTVAGGRFDPFVAGRRMGFTAQNDGPPPWAANPVIVKDGKVFVLPAEGKHLFVYDAATGAELKRIAKVHLDNPDTLLGVVDDRIVTVSSTLTICLDWAKYDIQKFNEVDDASIVWKSAPIKPRGRGFLTADSVWIPTDERVYRIELAGGAIAEEYPTEHKPWGNGEGPGNVLVTADQLVIAGANDVDVYTDLAAAKRRLDAEVAASPAEAGPLLRYAEVMFVAGQQLDAKARLDQAIGLMGGASAMRSGPLRDRVFADALTFAQQLSVDQRPERLTLANEMFDRAGAAASISGQQVQYRLSRGKFADAQKEPARAVALYQEILTDPALRREPRVDEATGEPTQASAIAEKLIQGVIARAGRGVYEPYDKAAAAAMEAALKPARDPEKLGAVAQTYPLSEVAPKALFEAAEGFEAAGQPKAATQVLRELYFKYPQQIDRAVVLESLARNALALPNRLEVAAARLAQASTIAGEHMLRKPLPLPDGKQIAAATPFADALKQIRGYRGDAQARTLPDFRLPRPPKLGAQVNGDQIVNAVWPEPLLAPLPEDVIPNVSVLVPIARDFVKPDRVAAWSSDGVLSVYAALQHTPMGVSNAMTESPREAAWVGPDLLIWGPTQIMLIPESGKEAKWKQVVKDWAPIEVVRAAADAGPAPIAEDNDGPDGQIRNLPFRAVNPRAQIIFGGGRLRNAAPGQFQIAAQPQRIAVVGKPVGPETIADVSVVQDRVLISTNSGRLLCLDTATGHTAWQTRLADRGMDRVVANDEFTVVKFADDAATRLIALDSFSGQIRGIKSFPLQPGLAPVNLALAADGTLVYTLPDRLVLRDLYKPWSDPERQIAAQPGQAPYSGATGEDQLVIAEGRILALAEDGMPPTEKFVRIHSLETGQPQTLRVVQDDNTVELRLMAGTRNWDASLRMVGPRLYVYNPRAVSCYNLDRPEESWRWSDQNEPPAQFRESFVGQHHVAMIDVSGDAENPRVHRLYAFSRYPSADNNDMESGRLDYNASIADPSGITAWEAVDGGFYYLSGDGKLHILRGAAKATGG